MSTYARDPESERSASLDPEYGAPATLLVYATVALGLAVSMGSLLFAGEGFGLTTAALVLLAVTPFLIYARLALARPGVEAVIGGVVLLALGGWGSVDAAATDGQGAFVRLSLMLVVLEIVIFAAGAVLRAVIPPRAVDDIEHDTGD